MSKGYRCYDPITNHMFHPLDVTFHEQTPFFGSSSVMQDQPLIIPARDASPFARLVPIFENLLLLLCLLIPCSLRYILEGHVLQHLCQIPRLMQVQVLSLVPPPPEPRYPIRNCKPPSQFGFSCSTDHPISQYMSYDSLSGSYRAFLGKIDSIPIPKTVSEALQNP